jgi:hypothetical protein
MRQLQKILEDIGKWETIRNGPFGRDRNDYQIILDKLYKERNNHPDYKTAQAAAASQIDYSYGCDFRELTPSERWELEKKEP